MTRSVSKQQTPGRSGKVARTAGLHHAHPGFTRFMAAFPRVSRFLAEHPQLSNIMVHAAHHIPVPDHYVPLDVHPGFTRFMATLPGVSRYLAEHNKVSKFVHEVAHHVPVPDHFVKLDQYVPLAPHIKPVFTQRARMVPRGPGM